MQNAHTIERERAFFAFPAPFQRFPNVKKPLQKRPGSRFAIPTPLTRTRICGFLKPMRLEKGARHAKKPKAPGK